MRRDALLSAVLSAMLVPTLHGQAKSKSPGPAPVTVPVVGCPSDGQLGPMEAPSGNPIAVPISAEAAQQLAYYESAYGHVSAPRGWHCFGLIGSSGTSFFVSSNPIDQSGFRDAAIQLHTTYAEGFSRLDVARAMARVFPAYRTYVKNLVREWNNDLRNYPFGPYATDKLT